MNVVKKITVVCLMICMAATNVFAAGAKSPSAAPMHVTSKNVTTPMNRKLNLNNHGVIALLKMADSKSKQSYVTVPDTLTVKATGENLNGKTETSKMSYRVGVIGGKAFSKNQSVSTIKLGKNVYQVNKEAFTPNKKLTKLIISGAGKIKFCKGCFNGLDVRKIKIVINANMSPALQREVKANLHALGYTNKLLASNVKFVKI